MKDIGIQLNEDNSTGDILDLKIEPKYDSQGMIISGLCIGSTLEQNKAIILIAHQGELKHRPDAGVGLEDLLLSSDYLDFRHKIREQFAKDGLKVTQLDLFENKPRIIKANYES